MNESEKWNDKLWCSENADNFHTFTPSDVDTRNNRWQVMSWMCVHCGQYIPAHEFQTANTYNHDEMYTSRRDETV
jgi:hypothetical protein